jgi:23S rRNA (adenine2503-C2)-methyltransferase
MKNIQDLEKKFLELKLPKFRIKQLVHAVCQEGIGKYEEIKVLPKDLRPILEKEVPIFSIRPVFKAVSKKKDTAKILFETSDGLRIEAVLMKYRDGRNSICVSSQAGCQMGCKFCATGTMRFGRSLTYEEIFDQVLFFFHLLKETDESVSNVIYMGMGEPFMNYDNVLASANLLNHPEYLNIGARKITISTSGIVDGIKRFTEEPQQFNLALSLHAPNQELREKIMPVSRRWKMDELLSSINDYIQKTNRRVSFEYVMLNGINDTPEIALELAQISHNSLIHVNIIPYNFTGIQGISGTEKEKIFQFQKILQNQGINATVRTTMGDDIAAACGQLANKNQTNE